MSNTPTSILKSTQYITIATVCPDGTPWNTPVSATFDNDLNFFWGSSPNNIHSQNIRNNQNVFVVVYDTNAPEGTGTGVYMKGKAYELDFENEAIKKYKFVPSKIWINDESKNYSGTYKHDVRIEIDIEEIKNQLHK